MSNSATISHPAGPLRQLMPWETAVTVVDAPRSAMDHAIAATGALPGGIPAGIGLPLRGAPKLRANRLRKMQRAARKARRRGEAR